MTTPQAVEPELRTYLVETSAESRNSRMQSRYAEIRAASEDAACLEATIRHAQLVGWRSTWVVSVEAL
jgi:hypothetical protein